NDDFQTSSSLELSEDGMVNTKVLANLPYSACEADETPLSPENCRLASLTISSPIYNLLVTPPLVDVPRHNLLQSEAENVSTSYKVGSQHYNRSWKIPTIGQLQWMIDQRIIKATSGERFWVQTPDRKGTLQVRWKTFSADVLKQTKTQGSVHRLANEQTPSVCDDAQCTNFVSNEGKAFYVVVRRNNLVHDMYAKLEFTVGTTTSTFEGWSSGWSDVLVPANATSVNFTYSNAHASSEQQLRTLENIQRYVNWLYEKPTLCWLSGGSIVSVTIGSSPHDMDYSEVGKKCK
ncbi:MAG: hypothetical protein ACRC9T_06080, partial [Vibrionaceae bacterium]